METTKGRFHVTAVEKSTCRATDLLKIASTHYEPNKFHLLYPIFIFLKNSVERVEKIVILKGSFGGMGRSARPMARAKERNLDDVHFSAELRFQQVEVTCYGNEE